MDPSADTLNGTDWDVVIVGTDVAQALLALALSRSGKRILHVDENEYYGGSHAAFTLQEATEWVEKVKGKNKNKNEKSVAVSRFETSVSTKGTDSSESASASASELSYSRAYSLSLSPQIIYARSQLLQALVSSKAFKQLEFLTVGSFWTYLPDRSHSSAANVASHNPAEISDPKWLRRVPNGREDIFADRHFTPQEKRNMMKFLRFISQYERSDSTCEPWLSRPLATFLTEFFEIPASLHDSLYALTMLLDYPENITTERAMDCFRRHVTSMGVFGPGFPAVVPRWGGMSEVAQVACRACAVGGGIYVLGKGIEWAESEETDHKGAKSHEDDLNQAGRSLRLSSGENITTKWLIGSEETLPRKNKKSNLPGIITPHIRDENNDDGENAHTYQVLSRSVSIVSSSLITYFAHEVEGAPAPAVAVVYFPAGAFVSDQSSKDGTSRHPPIQVLVHSSDTGECSAGQSVLYASMMMPLKEASDFFEKAVNEILAFADAVGAAIAAATAAVAADAVSVWKEIAEPLAAKTEEASTSNEQPMVSGDRSAGTTTTTTTVSRPPRTTQVLWRLQFEQHISRCHGKAATDNVDVEAKKRKKQPETKPQLSSSSSLSPPSPPSSPSNHNKPSRPKVAFLPAPLQRSSNQSVSSDDIPSSLSDFLVFDDQVLESVREVWEEIMKTSDDDNDDNDDDHGGGGGSGSAYEQARRAESKVEGESGKVDVEFMKFGDREAEADIDDDENVDDDEAKDGGDGDVDDKKDYNDDGDSTKGR